MATHALVTGDLAGMPACLMREVLKTNLVMRQTHEINERTGVHIVTYTFGFTENPGLLAHIHVVNVWINSSMSLCVGVEQSH